MTEPTFTRNSIAYKSDGTQVGVNVPRFESTGLTIEEGTTNLMASADALSLGGARVVTVTNGQQYTVSTYGASGSITLSGAGTGTVTPGTPRTITAGSTSLTLTPTGTPTLNQVENKQYATSWIDGSTTRQPESLTIPTSGVLTASQGTIEMDVNVTSQFINSAGGGAIKPIFAHTTGWPNNIIYFGHNTLSASWIVATSNAAGTQSTITILDASMPSTGIHRFAVKWDSTYLKFFVDGVLTGTPVSTPNIPSALDTTIMLGNNPAAAGVCCDAQISDLMLSSVARPDWQLQARGQP